MPNHQIIRRKERDEPSKYSDRKPSSRYDDDHDRRGDRGKKDESLITSQLKRLHREEIESNFLEQVQQLNRTIQLHDNFYYVRKNCHFLFDSLFELLTKSPFETCRVEAANTMGLINHLMFEDDRRYIEMVIGELSSKSKSSTSTKVLLLLSLKQGIKLDVGSRKKSVIFGEDIINSVLQVLEETEDHALMVACVDIFKSIGVAMPQLLNSVFQDLVDILVGWHIDAELPRQVTHYIHLSLQCFKNLWMRYEETGVSLLNQFIEDITGSVEEIPVSASSNRDADSDSPLSITTKCEHLIGVYSSVLLALPSTAMKKEHIRDQFLVIVKNVTDLDHFGYIAASSTLITSLCEIITLLIDGFTFAELQRQIEWFISFCSPKLITGLYECQLSYLNLLCHLLKHQGGNLSSEFISSIYCIESPLCHLRFSSNEMVRKAALAVDQEALALKNVPLLQDIYQYMLADMQICLNLLTGEASSFANASLVPSVSYNVHEAQLSLLYHLAALAKLCNQRNSIIIMYALNPSLFSLLAVHLKPTHPKLVTNFPKVQQAITFLLHSHCKTHSNFESSSPLFGNSKKSAGIFASFVPSGEEEPVDKTGEKEDSDMSGPSGNLSRIITILEKLFGYESEASETLLLFCLDWLKSLLTLKYSEGYFKALTPVVREVIKLSTNNSLSSKLHEALCALYVALFKFIPVKELQGCDWLNSFINMCWMKVTSWGENRALGYLKVLTLIPSSLLTRYMLKSDAISLDSQLPNTEEDEFYKSLSTDLQNFIQNEFKQTSLNSELSPVFIQDLIVFLIQAKVPERGLWQTMSRFYQNSQCNSTESDKHTCDSIARENLMRDLVNENGFLLMRWVAFQLAQYCVHNKLRTPLGRPHDTFTLIETTLRAFDQLFKGQKPAASTSKSITTAEVSSPTLSRRRRHNSDMENILNQDNAEYNLQVALLLQFIEALDIGIATYGSYGLPNHLKNIKSFYQMNKETCITGINLIRNASLSVANNIECPAHSALQFRDLFQNLASCVKNPNTLSQIITFARTHIKLHSPEPLLGLQNYLVKSCDLNYPFLTAAAHIAVHKHEYALDCLMNEYLITESDVHLNSTISDLLVNYSKDDETPTCLKEFIVELIMLAYQELGHYRELSDLSSFIQSNLTYYTNSDFSECASALSSFDNGMHDEMVNTLTGKTDPKIFDYSKAVDMHSKFSHLEFIVLKYYSKFMFYGKVGLTLKQRNEIREGEHEIERILQLLNFSGSDRMLKSRALLLYQMLRNIVQLDNDPTKCDPSIITDHWSEADLDLSLIPSGYFQSLLRYAKIIDGVYQNSRYDNSITQLEFICIKQARKQENFCIAKNMIMHRFTGLKTNFIAPSAVQDAEFTSTVCNHIHKMQRDGFNMSEAFLYKETAEILHINQESLEFTGLILTTVLHALGPAALLSHERDTDSTAIPNIENIRDLCARSSLKIGKWLGETSDDSLSYKWVILMQEMLNNIAPNKSKLLTSLLNATDLEHVPEKDQFIGHCISTASVLDPTISKTWFRMGSWSFKWGRLLLDKTLRAEIPLLSSKDSFKLFNLISGVTCANNTEVNQSDVHDKIHECLSWLPEIPEEEHSADALDDLYSLRLDETKQSLEFVETKIRNVLSQNNIAFTSDFVGDLMRVRERSIQRHYELYAVSIESYFNFFNTMSVGSKRDATRRIVAALRLVGLIVKHAPHLRAEFETLLAENSILPWKDVIPQIFARLNHSEGWVRQSFSNLLCRLAKDSPHLIVMPAIVGSNVSEGSTNKNITDMLAKFLTEKKDGIEGPEIADESKLCNIDQSEKIPVSFIDDEDLEEELSAEEEITTNLLNENSNNGEGDKIMHNCFNSLVNSLNSQGTPGIVQTERMVIELRRITVLWDELWYGSLTQNMAEIQKKMNQLKNECRRLNKNKSLLEEEKLVLLKTKFHIIVKPILELLEQLNEISSRNAETPHEKTFQENFSKLISRCIEEMMEPDDYFTAHEIMEKIIGLYKVVEISRSSRKNSGILSMSEISPRLANMNETQLALPGILGSNGQIIHLQSVDDQVLILPSKTRPKKLNFRGDDGRNYTYLFKGLEDLHLDERIMQFLSFANIMLSGVDKEGLYRAHNYSVIPLGPRSGLIQWVDNATSVFSVFQQWKIKESKDDKVERFTEVFHKKLGAKLKKSGISTTNRKAWPKEILREVVTELIDVTPATVLSQELVKSANSSSDWYKATRRYNVSSAVMSIIGFIIGLGDRHLDNILVRLDTGEVIHIDYNICFEKGHNLRVPERVPFRLTQNIETALGVTGVEGIFKDACLNVLTELRSERELFLTLLETFIYDPLVDWTHDADTGFTGAMYGGHSKHAIKFNSKQKQQEKDSNVVAMYKVRAKEIAGSWQLNRVAIQVIMADVIIGLEKLGANLSLKNDVQAFYRTLREQKDYLEAASRSSEHPCHTLSTRFKEYSRNKEKLSSVSLKLEGILERVQDRVQNHEASLKWIRDSDIPTLQLEVKNYFEMVFKLKAPTIENVEMNKSLRTLFDKIALEHKDLNKQFSQVSKHVTSKIWPMLNELRVSIRYIVGPILPEHIINCQIKALGEILESEENTNPTTILKKYESEKGCIHADIEVPLNMAKELAEVKLKLETESADEKGLAERLSESREFCQSSVDEEALDPAVHSSTNYLAAFAVNRVSVPERKLNVHYEQQFLSLFVEHLSESDSSDVLAAFNEFISLLVSLEDFKIQFCDALIVPIKDSELQTIGLDEEVHAIKTIYEEIERISAEVSETPANAKCNKNHCDKIIDMAVENAPWLVRVYDLAQAVNAKITSMYSTISTYLKEAEFWEHDEFLNPLVQKLLNVKNDLDGSAVANELNLLFSAVRFSNKFLEIEEAEYRSIREVFGDFVQNSMKLLTHIPEFLAAYLVISEAGATGDIDASSLVSPLFHKDLIHRERELGSATDLKSCLDDERNDLLKLVSLNALSSKIKSDECIRKKELELITFREKIMFNYYTWSSDKTYNDSCEKSSSLISSMDVECSLIANYIEKCQTHFNSYREYHEKLKNQDGDKHKDVIHSQAKYFEVVTVLLDRISNIQKNFRHVIDWLSLRYTSHSETANLDKEFLLPLVEYQRFYEKMAKQNIKVCERELMEKYPPASKVTPYDWIEKVKKSIVPDFISTKEKASRCSDVVIASQVNDNILKFKEMKEHFKTHRKIFDEISGYLPQLKNFKCKTGDKVRDYCVRYREFIVDMCKIFNEPNAENLPDCYQDIVSTIAKCQKIITDIYSELLVLCDEYCENQDSDHSQETDEKDVTKTDSQCDSTVSENLAATSEKRMPQLSIISSKGANVSFNPHALAVWKRVKLKLEGRDHNPNLVEDAAEQVARTISQAKDIDNLSLMYEGWAPYI